MLAGIVPCLRMTGSDRPNRRRLWAVLGGAYVSLSAAMFRQEPQMRARGGPGIVGLEMAGSAARVEQIIETWGDEGVAAARRSLIIDYGVLASYSPLMAASCAAAGRRLRARGRRGLGRLAPALAYGQFAAGACDAVENTALLAALAGRRGKLPSVARRSAQAKFLLLALGLLYSVAGALSSRG